MKRPTLVRKTGYYFLQERNGKPEPLGMFPTAKFLAIQNARLRKQRLGSRILIGSQPDDRRTQMTPGCPFVGPQLTVTCREFGSNGTEITVKEY